MLLQRFWQSAMLQKESFYFLLYFIFAPWLAVLVRDGWMAIWFCKVVEDSLLGILFFVHKHIDAFLEHYWNVNSGIKWLCICNNVNLMNTKDSQINVLKVGSMGMDPAKQWSGQRLWYSVRARRLVSGRKWTCCLIILTKLKWIVKYVKNERRVCNFENLFFWE